jgi:poly(3-hydroxybutyrate) depolymerase
MLYHLHELQRSLLDPLAHVAGAGARLLGDPPFTHHPGLRLLGASQALLHRVARRYEKPAFAVARVEVQGREVHVAEQVVASAPFCRLVHFVRASDDPRLAAALREQPRVLVCAPLSGHHASLLRDTVRSLLADHDVYVTDWLDAREVPLTAGDLGLDGYVRTIQRFIRVLDARALHVVAVCQPTAPVLAAVSLLAQAGEPTPRSLTLMGGPVDARRSPTAVNRLATDRPLAWFERNMIHVVPDRYAGRGRRVYPGFLQLTAFVAMNKRRHLGAYGSYWLDHLRGPAGAAARTAHERFYDDYNAVLDMDARYYLDTVRIVFQEFGLARGTWAVDGERVRPEAITDTALLTIEGELDDISGPGQTEAAHALCSGLPAARKHHYTAPGCGHYGIFSGHRWREGIYPRLREFVRAQSEERR